MDVSDTRFGIKNYDDLRQPKNLNLFLEHLDRSFTGNGDLIAHRDFRAQMEICKRFGVVLFRNDGLADEVSQWYRDRYGDKVWPERVSGYGVVEISGVFLLIKAPVVYGRVKLMPFQFVEKMGDSFWSQIAGDDIQSAANEIMSTISFYANSDFLTREARSDLYFAVHDIVKEQRGYGAARWSLLQCVEKTIKQVLIDRGEAPPYIHDLKKLDKLLAKHGLRRGDADLLRKVQCRADVRYEHETVNRMEAYEAYQATMELLKHYSRYMR